MMRVYSDPTGAQIDYLAHLLEDFGISCLRRNELLRGGAGELPPNETWPELWVMEDADAPRAQALIREALAAGEGEDWTCPGCGEQLGAAFAECWSCGTGRPP